MYFSVRRRADLARYHLITIAIAVLLSPAVSAQSADPMVTVEMRQQGFKDMGAAFKGVRDQFRRSRPVMVMIREYSRPLLRYSREPVIENWFPQGTGPGEGIETEALPVIWERPDEFAARWEDYILAAENLQSAVVSGDLEATRERVREMGDTCSGCHDTFREEED